MYETEEKHWQTSGSLCAEHGGLFATNTDWHLVWRFLLRIEKWRIDGEVELGRFCFKLWWVSVKQTLVKQQGALG